MKITNLEECQLNATKISKIFAKIFLLSFFVKIIDKHAVIPFHQSLSIYLPFLPDSSVVEQVTVNHLVAGSNPARAAIF